MKKVCVNPFRFLYYIVPFIVFILGHSRMDSRVCVWILQKDIFQLTNKLVNDLRLKWAWMREKCNFECVWEQKTNHSSCSDCFSKGSECLHFTPSVCNAHSNIGSYKSQTHKHTHTRIMCWENKCSQFLIGKLNGDNFVVEITSWTRASVSVKAISETWFFDERKLKEKNRFMISVNTKNETKNDLFNVWNYTSFKQTTRMMTYSTHTTKYSFEATQKKQKIVYFSEWMKDLNSSESTLKFKYIHNRQT